jgi:hydroxymethylpyrimidine pyrophosphatase-like HAD family hydrolase
MVNKFVTQLQLHLYTISSNGSIVFDFSKQLNEPFAFKAVDFALVVSTFKPRINLFGD